MELRQIQYFVSIIDNNSFSIAAEENYISQSAISQQIKALEKELGYDLIIRKNRSFELTQSGDFFYRESKRLLSEINNMKVKAKLLASQDSYTLKIGYLKEYNGKELLDTILEFKKKFPEVNIELISENHDKLSELKFNNQIDLMFSDQRRALSNTINNVFINKFYDYICVANYNKLAKKDIISREDIINETCIIICSKDQREIETKFYKDVLGFKGTFIYAESKAEAELLVASNKGFLLQANKKNESMNMNAIVQIPYYEIDGEQRTENFYAFWQKGIDNPIIENFVSTLKEMFRRD